MTDQQTLPRPGPVTVSAAMIIAGSVSIILLAFTGIAELNSIATRESVQSALGQWPFKDLNLSLDSALEFIRILSMTAGAIAAATAVLGVFVLRRQREARLALAVLAVPLLLSGMVTGGFLVTLVVISSALLWVQPARDWFDGIPAKPSARAVAKATREHAAQQSSSQQNAAQQGVQQGAQVPATGWPGRTQELQSADEPLVLTRPRALTWACIAAWVGSGMTLIFIVLSMIVIQTQPDQMIAQIQRQQTDVLARGVNAETILAASMLVGLIIIVWCVAALVFATLTFLRVGWSRSWLIGSAAAATVVSGFGAIGAPILLLPLVIACVVSLTLLMRPEVRQWFASSPTRV